MFYWSYNAVQTIYFPLVDSSRNEVTGLGSGFTVQLVKPGTTAYITLTGTKGEVGNGIYYYTNLATDADLGGQGLLKITDPGAIQQNITVYIGGGFVWTAPIRTLTQSAASVASAVSGAVLTVYRGVTWVIALTGLGSISDYSKIWFTVKEGEDDYDNQALVQVAKFLSGSGDGLLFLNGDTAATSGDGTIVIDDASAGDITITIDEAATAVLDRFKNIHYDVKILRTGGDADLLSDGVEKFNISAGITRAII